MTTMTLATAVLVINEIMASNVGEVMSPAINFDSWIELYNPSEEALNLGGMYLSDDASNLKRWHMPANIGSVPAKGYKVLWLGSNDIQPTQAPFKLDCDGGTIYLSNNNGDLIVSQSYPKAISHTAWARKNENGDEWGWTATATPGASNTTAVFAEQRLDAPTVSEDSRLFEGSLQVNVSIPEGATLMYTTDGSIPTAPKEGNEVKAWTDFIVNGNCEGEDATNFISHDADGVDEERIEDGVGYEGSRGIRVHAIANPKNDWDAQFFVYTPNHIWRSGERYRFRMKVRANKASRISVQTHTTPHNYIYWSFLEGNYNITPEWKEIVYEGTITDEQVDKQGGGWWGGSETVKDMQAIAFNLNIDKQENDFFFDDISWELYTADGQPTDGSQQSKDGQFSINKTTNLCLRLFQDGYLPSIPIVRSYIQTTSKYSIPVISIVGDKKYFTDPKIGIDCDGDGTNGKTGNGQDYPRNYNMDWDRPVNFSYLSSNGEMLFNQDVNICVSGGWTRSQRYRSFKLKSNKVFDGQNHLDFSFFPQKPHIRNKALLVRNGGNDIWTHNARFMDPALQTIIQRSGIDLDVQSYVPVIEYVNGELHGLLNLREPNNDKFVDANYGYDDDEIDMFENFEMKNGNDAILKQIFTLGEQINTPGAYDELKQLLDIDEFTNYMATELFLNNDDWPDNNIKAYRSQDEGRYRFITYDLDYAFALRHSNQSENPFLYFSTFKNMKFVTFFLHLLENDEYRRKFIDTFCLIAGSVFEPQRAESIVDELLERVIPMNQLMQQSMSMPDGNSPERSAATIKSNLKDRSEKMTKYMQRYEQMKLTNATRQKVRLSADTEGASLYVNGIEVPYASFDGHIFRPAQLEAKAPAGYRFSGWRQGTSIVSANPSISLPTSSNVALTATFSPMTEEERKVENITPVRINEVSAANGIHVNEYFKRNDWVELYNTTNESIDVEGMYLSDNPDRPLKYLITKGDTDTQTIIPAHGHLVIWCDKLETKSQLHASFKLAAEGGDVLLTSADESWTDRMTYTEMKPDETAGRYPDGHSDVYLMNVPTIGKANLTSSYLTAITQPALTGIRNLKIETDLSMRYQSGQLTIHSDGDGRLEVRIMGIAGQTVGHVTTTLTGSVVEIPVGNLFPGVYIATAIDEWGNKATCKFTVL